MEKESTESQQHSPRPFLAAAVLGVLIVIAAIFVPAAPAVANDSASPPGAPIDLAVAPGSAKLVVGWNPPQGDTNVTAYAVQYKASTATGWVDVPYEGNETDTEITGLTNDAGYDVRVRASNGAGDGQWSDTASATPHEDIVWSAILTVDVYGASEDDDDESLSSNLMYGCIDGRFTSVSIAECRTALTEDEFKFAGATYRWTSLYEATDPWHHAVMGFDSKVPSDSGLRTGTLQIGDETIYLGETDEALLRWLEDGDGWVVPRAEVGDPVFFPTKGLRLPMNLKARVPSKSDDDDQTGETQTSDDSALFEECRSYTQGLEGLRACVLPYEGREAVLMMTLSDPAPENGTTVTLATSPNQTATSDDFTMPSSITIREGETSGLIFVAITDDEEEEGYESIYIYACIRSGCDPLNPVDGEKTYNHGITIPATSGTGGL